MKEFRIHRHPDGETQAVKVGWSWPGAIFVGFWALFKQLWVIGGVVLVASLFLHATFLVLPLVPYSFDLAAAIVFGINGNGWRESNLADRGFELINTVEALTPDGAMAEHLRGPSEQSEEDGEQTPGNSTSFVRIEPKL